MSLHINKKADAYKMAAKTTRPGCSNVLYDLSAFNGTKKDQVWGKETLCPFAVTAFQKQGSHNARMKAQNKEPREGKDIQAELGVWERRSCPKTIKSVLHVEPTNISEVLHMRPIRQGPGAMEQVKSEQRANGLGVIFTKAAKMVLK